MCEKSVILLEAINSTQEKTESIVPAAATRTAIPTLCPDVPQENVGEGGKECPGEVSEQLKYENDGLSEAEAGMEAHVKVAVVVVVNGAPAVAISMVCVRRLHFLPDCSNERVGELLNFRNVSFRIFSI